MSVRTLTSVRIVVAAATTTAALFLTACSGPNLPAAFKASSPSSPSSSSPALLLPGDSSSGSGVSSPGVFNSGCLGVASAYSSIALALLPSLTGGTGTGTYDPTQVAKAIAGLGGSVPSSLKPDFQTLSDAARSASGKSMADAGQVLGSPAVTAASDDISKWMSANCGG